VFVEAAKADFYELATPEPCGGQQDCHGKHLGSQPEVNDLVQGMCG